LAGSGCERQRVSSAKTYDDCVLENIQGNAGEPAIATVKVACAQKFPKQYDFDSIAKEQKAPTWRDVLGKLSYADLNEEEKNYLEQTYFKRYVQPKIHPDFLDQAQSQFSTHIARIRREQEATTVKLASPPSNASLGGSSRPVQGTLNMEEMGEYLGAALAGTESIRMLSEESACAYMFRKRPIEYVEQVRQFLSKAPLEARGEFALFLNESSPVVVKLRQASRDIVSIGLRTARERLLVDEHTACGYALGSIAATSKTANDKWNEYSQVPGEARNRPVAEQAR
jgi:hypothetical protein